MLAKIKTLVPLPSFNSLMVSARQQHQQQQQQRNRAQTAGAHTSRES
jgi:hypothetical protein